VPGRAADEHVLAPAKNRLGNDNGFEFGTRSKRRSERSLKGPPAIARGKAHAGILQPAGRGIARDGALEQSRIETC
jgi:hypothetical protein